MNAPRFTALILAGSRRGSDDPVARAAGVAHKALAEVGGQPMLLRVFEALRHAPSIARIMLAVEGRQVIDALPELAALADAGTVAILPTAGSPAATVAAVLRAQAPYPLLVTTSDHALLESAMVEGFTSAIPQDVDVAAALCTRRTIEAAYPGSRRSYIRLGADGYSGCNLFAFLTPGAVKAATFWTRMEGHRKTPWKYALEIGIGPLLAYATGRMSLQRAFADLSRIMDVRGAPVLMPMAEAAIDVDSPADLAQVRDIVASRTLARGGPASSRGTAAR